MTKHKIDWSLVPPLLDAGLSAREASRQLGVTHTAMNRMVRLHGWAVKRRQRVELPQRVEAPQDEREDFDRSGFLYVLNMEDSSGKRLYKIGMARHFERRMYGANTFNPFKLLVTIVYFCENMRHEEATLHAHFAGKNVRGEWFELSSDDLAWVANRALIE